MTYVYGPSATVEPGGFALSNDEYTVDCDECGQPAIRRSWESVEGGSINCYSSTTCNHCGFTDGDGDDDDC